MSETTEIIPPVETPPPAPAPAPVDTAPGPATATETPAAPVETPPAPSPEEKKRAEADRRFARLTAKSAADRVALQKAEAERDAFKALLEGREKPDGDGAPKPAPTAITPEAVRVEARRMREEERVTERRTSLISDGVKELGEAAWNEKTSIIASLGATENAAFMQALMEMPNAPKLVAALADDSDRLSALLGKSPVAMAAEMGRMAAELDTKPEPKPALSGAPKPVTPVTGRTVPEPTVYDPKLSMKEYVALRQKEAPRHLGGARK